MEKRIEIHTPFIKLDAFLKLCAAAGTGGQAKVMVQSGQVTVNGAPCTMRGKKLYNGDLIRVEGDPDAYRVAAP